MPDNGPGPVCPGCGSPDVTVTGPICGDCMEVLRVEVLQEDAT